MVRRIKAKLVLRLREQGLSRNAIAVGYGMSKHSVIDVFDAACFASMFVRQVRQCFSAVWADGFPRCRHRFPVM